MTVFARITAALCAFALLSGCFVAPGKFVSTLDIRADRSFTFTFKGEILAMNMDKMDDASGDIPLGEEIEGQDSVYRSIAFMPADVPAKDGAKDGKTAEDDFSDAKPDPGNEKKMQAIAAALAKEKGFKSARYMGDNKFEVDYAISGTLTHGFVFPFNSDAKLVFPFIAIELRGDDRVRVKAPGYANSTERAGPMGTSDPDSEAAAQALDGTFTLTTDAEIVSQNQEDGPTKGPSGQSIVWKVDPLTTEAPMAVVRFPMK